MTGGVSVRDVDVSSPPQASQEEARDQTLSHKRSSEQPDESFQDEAWEIRGDFSKHSDGDG